jgi:hypothetical protein
MFLAQGVFASPLILFFLLNPKITILLNQSETISPKSIKGNMLSPLSCFIHQ